MKNKFFMGIDPGSRNSAFSFYSYSEYYSYTTMDIAERRDLILKYKPVFVVLEKVNTMPGQGIVSSGKFMKAVGVWQGILETLDIKYQEVSAKDWQKILELEIPDFKSFPKKEIKGLKKKHKLNLARARYPKADLKYEKSIDVAESLFMAEAAYKLANRKQYG